MENWWSGNSTKRNKKRLTHYTIVGVPITYIVFLIVALILILMIFSISLRLPTGIIRARLLIEVPLGSSEDEVIQFVRRRENWILREGISYAEPGSDSRGGLLARTRRVNMGNYRALFFIRVAVIAHWRFDEDGKLFELIIKKELT